MQMIPTRRLLKVGGKQRRPRMVEWFGLSSDDDEDSEHYLSDKFPYNPDTEMRGEEGDYIEYCFL